MTRTNGELYISFDLSFAEEVALVVEPHFRCVN